MNLLQDVKFGCRMLLKNPAFTVVAVLTLAIGIGANTAIFSIINGVLLQPLPYPEPDRLVTLWERNPARGLEQSLVSGPNFLDWEAENTVFENMAVNPGWQGVTEFNLVQDDTTSKIQATYVSSSFFPTLKVAPLLGRTFTSDEDIKGGNRVAVLSYGLWQRLFHGNSNILGQTITLDTYGKRDYTVVGVMPPEFGVPSRSELWLPLGWMGVILNERRSAHWHHGLARLKPGVTLDQARLELSAIQARIAKDHPEMLIGSEVAIVPLLDQALGQNLLRALVVLWGIVAGVLLIACANVANLLLARAAARRKEMAIRVALGASRGRVFRQILVESLLLGCSGGALGVLFAWWGVKLVIAASPSDIPRLSQVSIDAAALWVTVGASIFTGILFGLAPAWQSARPLLAGALKESGRGASAGQETLRLRSVFVVAEVALSVILLAGAGLMLRSFAKLALVDRGFEEDHLIAAKLDYSVSGFTTWVQPTATRPQVSQRAILERLRAVEGIKHAAVTSGFLNDVKGPPTQTILIDGRPALRERELARAHFTAVSPGFFSTMGVPLLLGRDFSETDQLNAPQSVILNESAARTLFPGEDPIGKRIAFPDRNNPMLPENAAYQTNGPWRTVVGLVADMRTFSTTPASVPQAFVPYWQWPMQSPTLLLRVSGETARFYSTIRWSVREVVPQLPPPMIETMDEIVSDVIARPRFQAVLVSCFGAVALGLAALGIYGLLAYNVSQRVHEIGIRVALGAQSGDVLKLIISQGMRLVAAGLAIGLLIALASSRVLRSLLYEISPADPVTFAVVSFGLIAVAFVACWLPARRASRIDPIVALRCE